MSQRNEITRRRALGWMAAGLGGVAAAGCASSSGVGPTKRRNGGNDLFSISLAEWSFHGEIGEGRLDHLDLARVARQDYGLDAVEYVNSFFKTRALDENYLLEMARRADDQGVRSLLIMCDGEGALGDADAARRAQSIENHVKWLAAATLLGCHSIRVNAASSGSYDEQMKLAADGLRRLTERAEVYGLNVIVENHGGLSSNGQWLAGVMRMVNHPRCGTLPDFGNFCMDWSKADEPESWYDRYRGVAEMMPFAKAVSAKSHDFDPIGNETKTDYPRMMRIVLDAGYRGHVGIEYEGGTLPERQGVRHTLDLLKRVRESLTSEYA